MKRKKKGRNMLAIEKLADEMAAAAAKQLGRDVRSIRGFRNATVRGMVNAAVEKMKPTQMRSFISIWRAVLDDAIKGAVEEECQTVAKMMGRAVGLKDDGAGAQTSAPA